MFMWMFERGAERELAGLDLALDAVQAGEDGVALRHAHDAGLREHRRVRLRPRDVLRVQPLVEADRGVYLLHERRRALGEVTAPERLRRPAPGELLGHDAIPRLAACDSVCCACSAGGADHPTTGRRVQLRSDRPKPVPELTFFDADGRKSRSPTFGARWWC